MFDLQEAIKIALQKAMQADSAKLETGEYDLTGTRVIIDLKGKMSKGAAEWHVPTTSIPTIATLALAIKMMGVQRDRFLSILEVAMQAAINQDEQASEYVKAFNEDVAVMEAKVRESMASLPPRRHEGKVYTKKV
jgi:ABC-type sulfate transport system substrate-binding protein